MKEISMIVPVYNTEKFLQRCLESLLNQSIIDLMKIIIVNDGTKDNSEDIILKFINKYPQHFEYYKQENQGLGIARNLGISKCTTKYIGFLDSDDYLDKYMVEKMYNTIKNNNCDIVSCGLIKCDDDGKKIGYEQIDETVCLNKEEGLEYFLSGRIEGYACNKIFKTQLFKENNIFFLKDRVFDDIITSYKLIKEAKSVFLIKDPLYFYVQHNESISHVPSFKTAKDILETLTDVIEDGVIHEGFIIKIMLLSQSIYYKWCRYGNPNEVDDGIVKDYKKNIIMCKNNIKIFHMLANKNINKKFKIKYLLFHLRLLNIYYIYIKIQERKIIKNNINSELVN